MKNLINRIRREEGQAATGALAIVGLVILALILILGLWMGLKAMGRYQTRQDALNRVKVSHIEIRNQKQRVTIAKQKAEIRRQNAIGVREAQDEIAKTLTPLYVQFEMTQALTAIARSGRNNSVVYLPSGANGIPLVATVDPEKVTAPSP